MSDMEFYANTFRQVAGNCNGAGAEVAAISFLRGVAANTYDTDAERVQQLRAVLAALDLVNAEGAVARQKLIDEVRESL